MVNVLRPLPMIVSYFVGTDGETDHPKRIKPRRAEIKTWDQRQGLSDS